MPDTSVSPSPIIPADHDASFIVPNAVKRGSKSGDEQGWWQRLVNYQRWLLVLAGSVVALAVVMGVVLAINLANPTSKGAKINQSPTPTPAEIKTSHDSGDDAYFADQPLTMLYYSYSQTNNSKNVFQSLPSDADSRFINVGFPDKYSFATSPNGKFLLRWGENVVEMAKATEPAVFTALYTTPSNQAAITDVQWAQDSAKIAVAYTNSSSQASKKNNSLVLVSVTDGSNQVLAQTEDEFGYDLRALTPDGSLYYAEDRQGLYSALTQFSTTEKRIVRQLVGLDTNGMLAKLQFGWDMQWGVAIEKNELVRYSLGTMERQVLLSLDTKCQSGPANATAFSSLSVSSSASLALLSVVPQKCQYSSSSKQDLSPYTILFNLNDKKEVARLANTPYTSLSASSWAPGEKLVWLQVDSQTAYTLSIPSLEYWPIPPQARNVLTKERPLLLGWLLPKN